MSVHDILILLSFVLVGVSLIMGMVRLLLGPTLPDRVIAMDAVVLCAVGFLALLSYQWDTPFYLDLLLVISLLGFLATVAFVNYLKEEHITKEEDRKDDR